MKSIKEFLLNLLLLVAFVGVIIAFTAGMYYLSYLLILTVPTFAVFLPTSIWVCISLAVVIILAATGFYALLWAIITLMDKIEEKFRK